MVPLGSQREQCLVCVHLPSSGPDLFDSKYKFRKSQLLLLGQRINDAIQHIGKQIRKNSRISEIKHQSLNGQKSSRESLDRETYQTS